MRNYNSFKTDYLDDDGAFLLLRLMLCVSKDVNQGSLIMQVHC